MITKGKQTTLRRRGIALAVSGFMLLSYFAPSAKAIASRAWKTSSETETSNPAYGNERVETSDYENLPLTQDGKLSYTYGPDSVKNGDFDDIVDVDEGELSENLAESGGDYEGVLRSVSEVGENSQSAVGGVWGNRNWEDGYAQIAYDGDNAVLKISDRGPEWSHALMNIRGKGRGKYTVSFDYRNVTGNSNVYCALGKLASGEETEDTWTEIRDYGHTDANLVSAPGWQGLNAGTPIEGRDGWYRYSHTYDVDFEGAELFRIWAYVGADANGAFLVDNVEITFEEEGDNLVEGGGTFEGILFSSAAPGESTETAVGGVWVNPAWDDSFGSIEELDGNAVLKLGYTGRGQGWAHAMHNFAGQGEGYYKLEFDYYNPTGNANAYVSLIDGELSLPDTSDNFGGTEANLFSAPGWQGLNAGTPVDGKEGWYHFAATIRATVEEYSAVHFKSYTGSNPDNVVYIDNVSVRLLTPEATEPTENLTVGGGSFEGVLQEGETEKELGTSFENPVAGGWGNQAWSDSYGKIVDDGGNAVVKLEYTTSTWAHAIFNFENKGKGLYLLEFDYYHNTDEVNAYVQIGNRTLNEALGTVQAYDVAGGSEANLFSAPGWKGLDAGTPIEGKEGWYHFSEYIDVSSEEQEVVRIWAYVNNVAENYLYMDNLSVKYMKPLSDSASYTLQENDPSGWTTTGTGVVSKVDGDFALTISSDGEAITGKSVNQPAGDYLLELRYRAEENAELFAEIGGVRYNLLDAAATESGNFRKVSIAVSTDSDFERLNFISSGTVVVDDIVLRSVEIDYNSGSGVETVEKFEGQNLVVGGGAYEDYLTGEETSAIVQTDSQTAVSGLWSNGDWTDSPAIVVRDGDNTYVKLGYVSGKGSFAHVIQNFENQGIGNYLVEFDYFTAGSTDNCYAIINDSAFLSGDAGSSVIGKGEAIEGKEGWFHFSAVIPVKSESMQYLRVWYNTMSSEENYILLDNLSVKKSTGTEIVGDGIYEVPVEVPRVPANIWSYQTDSPAVIEWEDENAVVRMSGAAYSSFFYGFRFEKAGVYAFSFDFKPEGTTDNIGFRINPVEETYTFDVPLLQYQAQWEESDLGDGWYHFIYYINIVDEVAYKDASFQFWCNSMNRATLTIDNLSVKRLVSATVSGNPVWSKEKIADGGFEGLLGNRESYTVPNVLNEAYLAVSGIWSTEGETPAKIVVTDNLFAAKLAGTEGYSSINHAVSLQNEGLYRVTIRYSVSEGYETRDGASLTYAFGGRDAEDILTGAKEDGNGYRVFTQYVSMTSEEAEAVSSISVRFACIDGFEAYIDYVSVKKEIGSDIPKEEVPDEDITGKKRYDIVTGGDFEGYEAGTSFGEEVTKDMFGTTSLDMPATIVRNDKDTVNTSNVLLLQKQEGSTKDFSSAFNLFTSNAELEKGRTYYVSFDYKYHIDEPLDTPVIVSDGRHFTMDEGFTFCFVGGTNIGHHEIWLGSVEDGDMTVGANNQKCEISKTDLGEGWARISFSFSANTGLSVACNSFRFLLLTNGNPNNYAMFDNVEFYTYYEDDEQPPQPEDPDDSDSSSSSPSQSGDSSGAAGCGSGCGSVGTGGAIILCGILGLATVVFIKKGKGRRKIK